MFFQFTSAKDNIKLYAVKYEDKIIYCVDFTFDGEVFSDSNSERIYTSHRPANIFRQLGCFLSKSDCEVIEKYIAEVACRDSQSKCVGSSLDIYNDGKKLKFRLTQVIKDKHGRFSDYKVTELGNEFSFLETAEQYFGACDRKQ